MLYNVLCYFYSQKILNFYQRRQSTRKILEKDLSLAKLSSCSILRKEKIVFASHSMLHYPQRRCSFPYVVLRNIVPTTSKISPKIFGKTTIHKLGIL